MIFCSTNKSELSVISKRSKIYDSDLSNTWFNLTSFLEIHLSKIERLTLYCLCFLIGSCLQTERHTKLRAGYDSIAEKIKLPIPILSSLFQVSSAATEQHNQPKVNKNKLFSFWEIEIENFDFFLCMSSRQHHINSTLRRKKKISRREENPKVDHPGGSSKPKPASFEIARGHFAGPSSLCQWSNSRNWYTVQFYCCYYCSSSTYSRPKTWYLLWQATPPLDDEILDAPCPKYQLEGGK